MKFGEVGVNKFALTAGSGNFRFVVFEMCEGVSFAYIASARDKNSHINTYVVDFEKFSELSLSNYFFYRGASRHLYSI